MLQLILDHVEVIEAFGVSEDEALLVLPPAIDLTGLPARLAYTRGAQPARANR